MGEKYLQIIWPITSSYAKIYKQLKQLNVQKKKNKQTWIKNQFRQKTQIDIFPKKTYRWPTGTRKDAQHFLIIKHMQIKTMR